MCVHLNSDSIYVLYKNLLTYICAHIQWIYIKTLHESIAFRNTIEFLIP